MKMFKKLFLMLSTFLSAKETENTKAAAKVSEVITEVNVGGDAGTGKIVVLKLRYNEVKAEAREPTFKTRPVKFKTGLLRLVREKRWSEVSNFWHVAGMSMGAGIIVGYVWGCTVLL